MEDNHKGEIEKLKNEFERLKNESEEKIRLLQTQIALKDS